MKEKILEELFPIGTEFAYLGRQLHVKKHFEVIYNGFSSTRRPVLICNYADNNGVIREASFNENEARIIHEKLERSQKEIERANSIAINRFSVQPQQGGFNDE